MSKSVVELQMQSIYIILSSSAKFGELSWSIEQRCCFALLQQPQLNIPVRCEKEIIQWKSLAMYHMGLGNRERFHSYDMGTTAS
jgi:hypothetical protein